VTQQFVQGLNPVTVVGIVARIPHAYALLLLILGALWYFPVTIALGAADQLAALWQPETFLPGGLAVATGGSSFAVGWLAHVFVMYVWLAMFACTAGMVYEHRTELDFEPAHSPERQAARANAELERQRNKLFDRIFAQLRGGALGNAGTSVRQLVEESSAPLEECRWLYARASASHAALANYIAQLMLPRLLATRATNEALRLVRERLVVDTGFKPASGQELWQVAQLARDGGDRPTARKLLQDFEQVFPNDPVAQSLRQLREELAR
jgi:hypothetical protein